MAAFCCAPPLFVNLAFVERIGPSELKLTGAVLDGDRGGHWRDFGGLPVAAVYPGGWPWFCGWPCEQKSAPGFSLKSGGAALSNQAAAAFDLSWGWNRKI